MSDLDRFTKALRSLVREMFPRLDFLGCYEYRVASQSGDTFDLQPVSQATGMPNLFKVPMRTGFAGAKATVASGSTVLVSFVNGDPGRPFVSWFDVASSDGFTPETSTIDASSTVTMQGGVLGAARMTDTVVAGPFGGTITGGSTKVLVG